MQERLKPIYLFSDSQLLFWEEKGKLFLNSVRKEINKKAPTAAYIGASNSDDPAFYEIFKAAMGCIGIQDCYMIHSDFREDDRQNLKAADVILLAGGDVNVGWNVFSETDLKETVLQKYYDGGLIIGISAGAIQLGRGWMDKSNDSKLLSTFSIVPMVIGVHEERQEWSDLKKVLQMAGSNFRAIGIPTGGGLLYYPDHSVEPLRHPVKEFSLENDTFAINVLLPPNSNGKYKN